MKTNILPTDMKEMTVYKSQIAKAEKYSTSLQVKTDKDYAEALAEGTSIKNKLEIITKRKEEITKPMNAALKNVRDLFKPLETAGETALRIIKDKMLSFTSEKTRQAEKAKLKIAQKVESGYYKPETGVEKMGAVVEQPKTISTENGMATTRMVTKYRLTDISKVPLKFHLVDMQAVKMAIKAGETVEGIETYQERELELAFNL
jgi:hypothetical protein